jgi:hypothetical protein
MKQVERDKTFCMGAASTTNHEDIILVRHNKRHFPIIMHTMQEEEVNRQSFGGNTAFCLFLLIAGR